MTIAIRGVRAARKLRRWFKRRVLRQPWMLEGFGNPNVHGRLLHDKIRCDAYREAIHRTVQPGDVVVDLGAGTGLLSFFALQAGARHVYAIEMSGIADATAELIEANGFRDRITLIPRNSNRVRRPPGSAVPITQTRSAFCFDSEHRIASLTAAGDR